MGYYQEEHWHITDIANLKGMLAEAKTDSKHKWKNSFITSINKVEFFYEAIWHDGKNALNPDTKVNNKPQEKANEA